MKPKSAKNAKVTARLAAVKRRLPNSRTSSIGTRVRHSAAAKAARSAAVTAKPVSVACEPQPRSGASMIVCTSSPSAIVLSTSPRTSSRGVDGSRLVGT